MEILYYMAQKQKNLINISKKDKYDVVLYI